MHFFVNRKLATRIGMVTTALIFAGMFLLWFIVSSRVSRIVEGNITNQMIDVVESRASIINDYVSSAEEYMTAFALGSEVRELLADPEDPVLVARGSSIPRILRRLRVSLKVSISGLPTPIF